MHGLTLSEADLLLPLFSTEGINLKWEETETADLSHVAAVAVKSNARIGKNSGFAEAYTCRWHIKNGILKFLTEREFRLLMRLSNCV